MAISASLPLSLSSPALEWCFVCFFFDLLLTDSLRALKIWWLNHVHSLAIGNDQLNVKIRLFLMKKNKKKDTPFEWSFDTKKRKFIFHAIVFFFSLVSFFVWWWTTAEQFIISGKWCHFWYLSMETFKDKRTNRFVEYFCFCFFFHSELNYSDFIVNSALPNRKISFSDAVVGRLSTNLHSFWEFFFQSYSDAMLFF